MTIPTYPIEPRDYEAEHAFVQHFGRMFKNLVRQYMLEYPTTDQQSDILAQMQDRTSVFAPYVWSGPASDMPQGEPLEVTGELGPSELEIVCNGLAYIIREYPEKADMARDLLTSFSSAGLPAKPKSDALLRAALYALEYHQSQTRPIQLTTETLKAIRSYFNEVSRT